MIKRRYNTFLLTTFIAIVLILSTSIYLESNFTRNVKKGVQNYYKDQLSFLDSFELPDLESEIQDSAHAAERPWYMINGKVYPSPKFRDYKSLSHLFINAKKHFYDKIEDQLMFMPDEYDSSKENKIILMYRVNSDKLFKQGNDIFKNCPVNKCIITKKKKYLQTADAVIFDKNFQAPIVKRHPLQIWILYMTENPASTIKKIKPPNLFNWTISYRPDSVIPVPYGKWIYHSKERSNNDKPIKNFAANKTRKVAWFVSNCNASNSRLTYAKNLAKYIQVDIFGDCGKLKCPKSKQEKCFKLLAKTYKFYLAFESAHCKFYMTEIFFKNALRNNVIPIVMGARKTDYKKYAPLGSFIHVEDFPTPESLATYLHTLDQNDDLFNEYFLWRGTGEFIDTYPQCRLCSLLHSTFPQVLIYEINFWLEDGQQCYYR